MLDNDRPIRLNEASERSRLDPFVVATGDAPPRDQRDLMERPFFSLAKRPRTKPILYKTADVEVQVFAMPEHGMLSCCRFGGHLDKIVSLKRRAENDKTDL